MNYSQIVTERVLYNKDLRNLILDYSGFNVKHKCKMCDEKLIYDNFTVNVNISYKKYNNWESCSTHYFCDEICYREYKRNYSNKKCFLILVMLMTSTIFCTFLLVYILNTY